MISLQSKNSVLVAKVSRAGFALCDDGTTRGEGRGERFTNFNDLFNKIFNGVHVDLYGDGVGVGWSGSLG